MSPRRGPVETASAVDAMSELLLRVAREIADIAKTSEELQDSVGTLLQNAIGRQSGATIHKLQSFDDMAQKLAGLSEFLAVLATHVPAHWNVDPREAAAVIKLAHLAARLRAESPQAQAAEAGELELF